MPSVTIRLAGGLSQTGASAQSMGWDEEFALGDTLGRLFARMVVGRPDFEALYNPVTRRLAESVALTVNGRNYQLIGGVTYLLHNGDELALSRGGMDLGPRD